VPAARIDGATRAVSPCAPVLAAFDPPAAPLDELPWRHFNSLAGQWDAMPTFAVGELLFATCAVLALVHATRCGRDHLLIWIAALVAGTANDQIFMALPLVNNFWQAQATVMLTARMPLYIPLVYVCFMYYPAVAARRAGLGRWATGALTGLLASLFYAPYDIVGAKFLWWSWHDTDPPIAARILGAPVGSTLWVLTFVAVFGVLLYGIAPPEHARRPEDTASPSLTRMALGLALLAATCTPLMMVQMTVLQQLDGGTPGYVALAVATVIYAAIAITGLRARAGSPSHRRPHDGLALAAVLLYALTLPVIMAVGRPETHRSLGVHQELGPCYVEAKDITGQTRFQYLCATDFAEDFDFSCAPAPEGHARWYTICGRAHSQFAAWMAGVALLGLAIAGAFAALFGGLAGPATDRRAG